jgi:acetyl/propionyl-CoA carboxylase alpha subunit
MSIAKVLVSNRSEIACRIFQACREMGLHTVGVVAPGDEEARHVTYADEIFPVSSYLDIGSMLEVAQRSHAKLIHPGYGFLSERPAFAKSVEQGGFVFVGPRAETMELMGGKIAAKDLAARVGVPTLPWARVERGGDILLAAKKVGFPLLLKASAGGGGKGMRRVDQPDDLLSSAESASAEALSAFGDGTLFIERLVDNPRHIEVQVFGNGKGEGIHLHERECSLQRRHQKIWEEATAPYLKNETRQGLFAAAMKLVQATQYRNAGTIEFLVDESENFYFLEMNTRLQVEHPVTESVTGVDLVWAQLAQALAPEDTILRESPSVRGHAIEVRLYAEDPAQGFIPTPGKIEKLRWPTGAGIRVESGIEEGQTVGTQFDSMLGKLIVYAQSRAHAIERLKFALGETVILGIGTNQEYLHSLACHPKVREGLVNTAFLSKEFGNFHSVPSEEDLDLLRAARTAGLGKTTLGQFSRAEKVELSPWIAFSKS